MALFMAGVFVLRSSGKARHELLFQDWALEKGASFDKILKVKGALLESYANDYSYWDEMVRFVSSGDRRWAYDNIDTGLDMFGADAAWVLRPDLSGVYSAVPFGDEGLNRPPLPRSDLEKLFSKGNFPHFFVNTTGGLMEVRGAPIQPAADYERKSRPRGYFLAGRLWDKDSINEIASLTGTVIDFHPPGYRLPESAYDPENGATVISRTLYGWDGSPLARIHAESRFSFLGEEEEYTGREVIFFLVFSLSVLAALSIFLSRWVGAPLRAISRSMDTEDMTSITGLQKNDNEFGRLARLIQRSFAQRDELVREVAERKRSERALAESEAKFRILVEDSMVGVYIIQDGRPIYVNPRLAVIFGLSMEEVAGIKSVEEVIFPDDWPQTGRHIGELISGETERVHYEFRGVRKDGTVINAESFASRATINGRPAIIGTILDITDRKLAEEMRQMHEQHLDYLAHHDALTGLPNRALFSDRLDQTLALARRHKQRAAVMMLDVDHFKTINDTLGHAAGDKLLKDIAKRLKGCLRDSDTVARLGGDEFCIIITDITQKGYADTVARKVLDIHKEPFDLGGHGLYVTLSMGMALFPVDGRDSITLLKNADLAMYRAKEMGRNNYQPFSPGADYAGAA